MGNYFFYGYRGIGNLWCETIVRRAFSFLSKTGAAPLPYDSEQGKSPIEDIKKPCCDCRACISSCPVNCIELKTDLGGFHYYEIDIQRCINCGTCKRVCPINKGVDAEVSTVQEPETFAVWSMDDDLRLRSSSGGVFSVFAKKVLNEKGVVFGAAFDPIMSPGSETRKCKI